jgi:GH25 family lysozyme M1 (1,4-beta-N-acetylmuramidase)
MKDTYMQLSPTCAEPAGRFPKLQHWLVVMVPSLMMLVGPERALAQRPLGIDVSVWQGTGINWTNVKNSGVTFAWVKASQGDTITDSTFAVNIVNARNAGVLVGAYHFADYTNNIGTAGADAEAAYFWNVVKNYIKGGGHYLMPVLDAERNPAGGGYTKTSLSQWINRWCQDIVNYAAASNVTVRPIIYTGISYANTWIDSSVTQLPLWMANPSAQNPQTGAPAGTSPWSTWNAWQYSWTGSVPGVPGDCDLDVYNGTYASFVSNMVIGGSVNITNPPTIVSPPQSLTLNLGSPASFSVSATGVGPLHFQWRFNQTNIAGATATNYSIASVQLTNAGGYSVAVSNAGGVTVSAPGFLSVLSKLTNAPGCILSPANLVNWWPGDGNLNDIFSTNKATPHDGFSYTTGKQGQAFRFDGLTGYASVTATSIPPPWTACLWVNRQNAPTPGAALLSDGDNELKLEQYNGTRQVGVTRFSTGADATFGYIAPVGVWTHLAFVGTGAGTSLYTNGVFQSTLTNVTPLPRAYIGTGYVISSVRFVDFMQGGLDEILLFNRVLNGSEINAIYAAGAAGLVRAPEFTGIQSVGDGQVQVNLKGQTGKNFMIYASTNGSSWMGPGVLANPTGSAQFTDYSAINAQLFYRASQP